MSNKRGSKIISAGQKIRTIDTKHTELLEKFHNIDEVIIPNLKHEKLALKESVNSLNENQLDEFMIIKDQIAEINKEIKTLKLERKKYLLDNSKHVFEYFEQKQQISNDSNLINQIQTY